MKLVPTLLCAAAFMAGSSAAGYAHQGPGPSSARRVEDDIAARINAYRRSAGLPGVPRSPALDRVARAHTADLAAYHPDQGTDSRGIRCNTHSWSPHGNWRPVCYTWDHHYAARMWSKPREITGDAYPGYGYEISSGPYFPSVTAAQAVDAWQRSSAHNAVILQQGHWARAPWLAMGVGVSGGYAVVWFGREPDRAAR